MTHVYYRSDAPPTLAEAQALVGGLVDLHELPDGRQLISNVSVVRYLLEVNMLASELVGQAGLIRGNCLILEGLARWN